MLLIHVYIIPPARSQPYDCENGQVYHPSARSQPYDCEYRQVKPKTSNQRKLPHIQFLKVTEICKFRWEKEKENTADTLVTQRSC